MLSRRAAAYADTEAFEAAADHRRAELASGRIWDKIPPHVWQYVK
ncbi:RmoA [Escherichia coli]|nr:RmoA [Escherichia coli]